MPVVSLLLPLVSLALGSTLTPRQMARSRMAGNRRPNVKGSAVRWIKRMTEGDKSTSQAAGSAAGVAMGGTAAASASEYETPKYPDKNLKDLFASNQRWRAAAMLQDHELFEKLSTGQWPKYLWIGCSDSRVPETTILGMKPGDVFTVRNIANQVQRQDIASQSAIAFGVGALGCSHIIVCGHYGCGGIRAALSNVDHGGPLENWLTYLRDVYRLHKDELDAIKDQEAKERRFVELNVLEQCLNVYKTDTVQKFRTTTKSDGSKEIPVPTVTGLIYDISTGNVKKLDVDVAEYADKYKSIYTMYEPDGGIFVDDYRSAEDIEAKKVNADVEEIVKA
ncbi:hypothetical protein AAMO2058_000561100 [Amorphochlora amoebiformis]